MFCLTALITPSGTPKAPRKKQRQAGKFGGHRYARQNFIDGGLFGDVGVAEVALQETTDPLPVLCQDRQIEAEFRFEARLFFRIDEAG